MDSKDSCTISVPSFYAELLVYYKNNCKIRLCGTDRESAVAIWAFGVLPNGGHAHRINFERKNPE